MTGLAPLGSVWDLFSLARRQLVLSSRAFYFPCQLPANAQFVGPVLDDPAWASDAGWTEPGGEGPLVLVAMSPTFQDHAQCLQRIIDALGTLPVRGVVTAGPAIKVEDLVAPANVSVMAAAPHTLVMGRAALVATHGGHGTVMKALAAGRPLVVQHHGRDQADNAVRVSARGAGKAVPRRVQRGCGRAEPAACRRRGVSPPASAPCTWSAGRRRTSKRAVAAAPTGLRWDHG